MALACDAWDRVEDNIWAIAKHIDALRGQQRWGVGTIEQAFRGYQAYLPAPKEDRHGEGWWTALHISSTATPQEVEAAYRKLAAYYHPDSPTGNEQMMVIINQAISDARKEFKSS
ncbi:MAG: J domain-containing protein [Leptolyngbyaceae cyanobacterium RU_5_1]|nr:J domain-containing protein [Leptolyngbyaceae cyanobacterium RU_5_1]